MKSKKIIPVLLLAAPLIYLNSLLDITDAASGKSAFNLKLLILNRSQYEDSYDVNSNGTVDVFDMIRLKQDVYGLGVSGLNSVPAETTVLVTTEVPSVSDENPSLPSETTLAVTTTNVITSAVVSADTTEVTTTDEGNAETTVTANETTVASVTTTALTTTETQVTTTEATTTEAPVTTTVTETEPPVTTPVTTEMPSRKIISSVRSFVQGPELPTGCEATGLAIAVRWYGYDVGKTEIAMTYMPRQDFRWEGSKLIGADFIYKFAGDPSREAMSYGCYIPCMVQTVDNYFKAVGSSYRGKNISGTELEDLFPYIANNTPVILISTPELMTPRTGDSWYTDDGRYVTWQRGHHCMVLIGYDKINQRVYCADPMMKAGIVSWNISEFRSIYNQKGKNAMIIDTGSVNSKKELKVGDTIRYVGYANSTSQGNGSEVFLETNLYTITQIIPDRTQPYPVCIGNIGWVGLDAIYENIPYYGNGNTSSGSDSDSPVSNEQIYNIVNVMSGKYLNVDYGIDKDGTNIYQWSNDGSTEQKFKIKSSGDAWKIYAMCSSSGNSRLLTATGTNNGDNIYLFKSSDDKTQQWTIKKIRDNAYCIALKNSPDYVLTVPDNNNGLASGTGSSSAGNAFISKYTGEDNQLWYFRKN